MGPDSKNPDRLWTIEEMRQVVRGAETQRRNVEVFRKLWLSVIEEKFAETLREKLREREAKRWVNRFRNHIVRVFGRKRPRGP